MLWRRSRPIWTDPLQPPSQYVNVLGTKLRMLFRAPADVNGNTTRAVGWADEISLLEKGVAIVAVNDSGTPTLTQDGTNFSGRPVVRLLGGAQRMITPAQVNPLAIIDPNSSIEMFSVIRFASLTGGQTIFRLLNAVLGSASSFSVQSPTSLRYLVGGRNLDVSFSDTTAVHFIAMRYDAGPASLSFYIDGADVASTVPAALIPASSVVMSIGTTGTAFDGFLGMFGYTVGAMTAAERAEVYRIARQEFTF